METVSSANSYFFLVFSDMIYQAVNKGTGVLAKLNSLII